jgi:protein-disulfide isomerase
LASATRNRLNTVVNIAILAAILILLFGPMGPMGRWFADWRADSQQRTLVESSWDELMHTATIIAKTPSPADTVVMFTDYECPFCRSVEPSVQLALAGGVAIALLHLPLEQIHLRAREAASAAICSEEHGKLADVHRALMESENWMAGEHWDEFAGESGIVEPEAFVACMASERTSDRVTASIALATRLGVTGTPAFVLDSGIELGADGIQAVLSLVDTVMPQTSYELKDVAFVSVASPHEGVSTIGRLTGGLMLDQNRIVLADGMSMRLFFVNIDSGEVRTVGRQGDGPGEFRRIRGIGRTELGAVFVDDFVRARVTVFNGDGSLADVVSYNPLGFRGGIMIPKPIGVHADGAVIFRDADPLFSERPSGPYRERIHYVALMPDGSHTPITEASGLEKVRRNYGPTRFNVYDKPFSYSALETVADHLVLVADTESGYTSAYDRSGDVVMTFSFGRGIPISKEADRLWREERIARTEHRNNPVNVPADARQLLGGMGGMEADEKQFYRSAEGNAVAPSLSRILVDGDGRLWAQRYVLPGDDTAVWQRGRPGKDGLDAILELPADQRVLDAMGNRVLLRTTDELGVPRAVVATLRVASC